MGRGAKQVLAGWGQARYLSVTETVHNTEYEWAGKKQAYCFFYTWMSEQETNPRPLVFKAGSFNHCTRAIAQYTVYFNPLTAGASYFKVFIFY